VEDDAIHSENGLPALRAVAASHRAVHDHGYRVVWTPLAELFHLECASRGWDGEDPAKRQRANREWHHMRKTWVSLLEAADLRAAGILYPNAGCLDSLGSGHHNIVWQISRDRRFDREYGDIEVSAATREKFVSLISVGEATLEIGP
jgi:hypothetical protein